MVWTRSMATNPKHQDSGNAFSHPNHATKSPSAPIQQQLQSMAATMANLTQQNQELTREVNRQRRQRCVKEHGKNSKNGREGNDVKGGDQSKGTVTRRLPHLEREMDQMKKAIEEMKDSMRKANHMDDLVHRTDSPFTVSIMSHPLPSKFKMSSLESYDGTRDPCDHITMFKTTMHFQGISDEIMCRAFPTTLKGPAKVGLESYHQTP